MIRTDLFAVCLATCLLAGCAAEPTSTDAPARSSAPAPAVGDELASGTVTGISETHGNAYTSIAPERYEPLGLTPGMRLYVVFTDAAIVMDVGRTYADVPIGDPVAVLHREGLTFAVRDGNFAETFGIAIGEAFTIAAVGDPPTSR